MALHEVESLDEDRILRRDYSAYRTLSALALAGDYEHFVSFLDTHMHLENLGRERAYRLITAVDDLARDRAEDAVGLGLLFVLLDEHDRVFIESDVRAVLAAEGIGLAGDDGGVHALLLHRLARLRDRKSTRLNS